MDYEQKTIWLPKQNIGFTADEVLLVGDSKITETCWCYKIHFELEHFNKSSKLDTLVFRYKWTHKYSPGDV